MNEEPQLMAPLPTVPQGAPMKSRSEFSPELEAALETARTSGDRYMVAVWTESPDGDIVDMHRSRGKNFSIDRILRAFMLFRDNILAIQFNEGRPDAGSDDDK